MLVETIVGLCVGVIARYVIPDSRGIGEDTLTGIVGGGLGAFIYGLFGHKPPWDDFSWWGMVSAGVGALILILVVRAAAGRRTIA